MLARFSSLPHGLELLEGNVHDQDIPPNGELIVLRPHGMLVIQVFPLDPRPPWGTLTKLHALASHYCRNPTLAKCGGEAQHLEKVRSWSPPGLPNV
jgi:hypothetical protein